MRQGWTRTLGALTPSADDVAAIVRASLPKARVAAFEAVDGGLANTNIRVDLDDGRVLLRLYQRDGAQAAKEAALAERLRGTVPVARFLHIGEHGDIRFALVEWIDGTRLEIGLPTMAPKDRRAAGHAVGQALGAIHGFAYERIGFLDAQLRVASPISDGPDFLLAFLRGAFIDGPAHALLGDALARAAMDHATAHKNLRWGGAPCLVHCDFNGSNILMRGLDVAAVVDWEFAMSARPDIDFGNLLRNHPDEAFLDGVVAGYRARGRSLPENWRALARLSDLMAWADLLSRPHVHPSVVESAKQAILETIGAA